MAAECILPEPEVHFLSGPICAVKPCGWGFVYVVVRPVPFGRDAFFLHPSGVHTAQGNRESNYKEEIET